MQAAAAANAAAMGALDPLLVDPQTLAQSAQHPSPLPASHLSWISWLCSLKGHEFLIEVDRYFIRDKMNLIKMDE